MENKYFQLDFEKCGGLIPAIVQDFETGMVLMLAYMNKEAWEETITTGRGCYYSRSRNKLWRKGESSGNVQEVKEILIDCDNDTVVLKVNQIGKAACHTGHESCFFRKLQADGISTEEISAPLFDPDQVYGGKH